MSNTPLYTDSSHDQAWVHKTIRKRWNDIFQVGSTISVIERWPDDNYTPRPIPVKQYDTEREHLITAELNGFKSTNLCVDVHRGCLIILAARAGIGSEGEHYCEVPLPKGINQRMAELAFSEGLLTVSFRKTKRGWATLRLALAKSSL